MEEMATDDWKGVVTTCIPTRSPRGPFSTSAWRYGNRHAIFQWPVCARCDREVDAFSVENLLDNEKRKVGLRGYCNAHQGSIDRYWDVEDFLSRATVLAPLYSDQPRDEAGMAFPDHVVDGPPQHPNCRSDLALGGFTDGIHAAYDPGPWLPKKVKKDPPPPSLSGEEMILPSAVAAKMRELALSKHAPGHAIPSGGVEVTSTLLPPIRAQVELWCLACNKAVERGEVEQHFAAARYTLKAHCHGQWETQDLSWSTIMQADIHGAGHRVEFFKPVPVEPVVGTLLCRRCGQTNNLHAGVYANALQKKPQYLGCACGHTMDVTDMVQSSLSAGAPMFELASTGSGVRLQIPARSIPARSIQAQVEEQVCPRARRIRIDG